MNADDLKAAGYKRCGPYADKIKHGEPGPILWQKKLAEGRFVNFWDWSAPFAELDLHPCMHWEAELQIADSRINGAAINVTIFGAEHDVAAIEAAATELFDEWQEKPNASDR